MHDINAVLLGFRRSMEASHRHLAWDHLPAILPAWGLFDLYSHDFPIRLNPWLQRIHQFQNMTASLRRLVVNYRFVPAHPW